MELLLEEDRVLDGEADELGQWDSDEEVVWEFVFLDVKDGLLEDEGLDEPVNSLVEVNPGLTEAWSDTLGLDVWDTEAVEVYESCGEELSELEKEAEAV